jgi:hypothetical protein
MRYRSNQETRAGKTRPQARTPSHEISDTEVAAAATGCWRWRAKVMKSSLF